MAEHGSTSNPSSTLASIRWNGFGQSEAMDSVIDQVQRASRCDFPVFLLGEPGVGKRWIAESIHRGSARSAAAFASFHPMPSTPSIADRAPNGSSPLAMAWDQSGAGSLYLAPLGLLGLADQAWLVERLRVQLAPMRDAGGVQNAGPRMLFASNSDLHSEWQDRQILEELYWSLQILPIRVPPLRERVEEIPLLAMSMLQESAAWLGREVRGIDDEVMQGWMEYEWPGNLSELEAVVRHAAWQGTGSTIRVEDLPAQSVAATGSGAEGGMMLAADFASLATALVKQGLSELAASADNAHQHVVDRVERELILQVLQGCHFVQTKAATRLGINRNTLHKKVKEYGLDTLAAGDGGA